MWLYQRPPQHETGKPHGWCMVPTTEAHPAYGRPPARAEVNPDFVSFGLIKLRLEAETVEPWAN